MSRYPTPSDYQEALQAPEVAFDDPELRTATPRSNVLGLPKPVTGAFAAVFPMTTDTGRTVAAKCFLTEVPDQERRYRAVSRHLEEVSLEALVDVDFQSQGIHVEGTAYPLLKMNWVDGTVLNRFVEQHLDAPATLSRLAEAWADVMTALEKAHVAHGDLQHGNVLVQERGDDLALRLVDYDTMYVPALDGWRSPEVGHRNYQHPDRTDADFGPYLDRFSGLAIYTAIRACVDRPDLWDEFDTGENLLFRDSDFYDPDQSTLFEALTDIESVGGLTEALHTACYLDPADVPSLDDVREGRLEPASVSVARARRQRGRSTRARSLFAKAFLPGIGAVAAAAVLLTVTVGTLPAVGVAVVGMFTALGWGGHRYRRLSLVRRRRRLEQEVARFDERISTLTREVRRLQEKREARRTSIESLRDDRLAELQDEALYDALKHHFIGEVRDVDGVIHKHVVWLKAANIRTAYEATPEAVADVRRISDEARTRINQWRAALVREYEDQIPETLSPAEERRLRRYVEHQIENLDDDVARAKEKIEVQKTERDRIRARLDELESLSFGHYVRYLLRLAPLPQPDAETVSSAPAEVNVAPTAPQPVPEPLAEEDDWWRSRD